MTSEQFTYWLQGYFEIQGAAGQGINPKKAKIIEDHLKLVFKKETPTYEGSDIGFVDDLLCGFTASDGSSFGISCSFNPPAELETLESNCNGWGIGFNPTRYC